MPRRKRRARWLVGGPGRESDVRAHAHPGALDETAWCRRRRGRLCWKTAGGGDHRESEKRAAHVGSPHSGTWRNGTPGPACFGRRLNGVKLTGHAALRLQVPRVFERVRGAGALGKHAGVSTVRERRAGSGFRPAFAPSFRGHATLGADHRATERGEGARPTPARRARRDDQAHSGRALTRVPPAGRLTFSCPRSQELFRFSAP